MHKINQSVGHMLMGIIYSATQNTHKELILFSLLKNTVATKYSVFNWKTNIICSLHRQRSGKKIQKNRSTYKVILLVDSEKSLCQLFSRK